MPLHTKSDPGEWHLTYALVAADVVIVVVLVILVIIVVVVVATVWHPWLVGTPLHTRSDPRGEVCPPPTPAAPLTVRGREGHLVPAQYATKLIHR